MIEFHKGDILKTKTDALVNTVNCVGVMGRGIALQFKKAYPEMFTCYKKVCEKNELWPDKVLTYNLDSFFPPHYIINVPTKRHWRGKSRIEDIEAGLKALVDEVQRLKIDSIAIPPLGAGLGGLDWDTVKALIVKYFSEIPGVRTVIFEPRGAPEAKEMVKQPKAPNMTEGRAALLCLMQRYLAALMDPSVTLLEIHKLMYFMQEAGQPLKLNYSKGIYGPYATNLRHVMTHIEGHFIDGYGDAADKPDKEIEPRPQAMEAAEDFLKTNQDSHSRLNRVSQLIEGFETPFGMELLSTVHWVVTKEGAVNYDQAAKKTYEWGDRKKMFKEKHLRVAYDILNSKQWLSSPNNAAE
ncbi:MAG: macro domain-containing protein [Desulfobacterales bacterium]